MSFPINLTNGSSVVLYIHATIYKADMAPEQKQLDLCHARSRSICGVAFAQSVWPDMLTRQRNKVQR